MYACLTQTNLGTIDNDAKLCFDRIICNVEMLISRYNGITSKFCNIQSSTLKQTIFKL
jgi:hypothetical protein